MDFDLEKGTAEALLDVGVSVPLKEVRIPWRKEPVKIRLVMRRPLLGNLIKIASTYLDIGVTHKQISEFNKEEQMQFLVSHGAAVSKIVSIAILGGHIYGRLFIKPLAWILRWIVDDVYLYASFNTFVSLLGTKDFGTIIRSLEGLNPMSPMILSQKKEKGS
ncbi:MAG: hypothetical protein WCS17_00060 [Prevotella sp.]|jgi:hypothetical protein